MPPKFTQLNIAVALTALSTRLLHAPQLVMLHYNRVVHAAIYLLGLALGVAGILVVFFTAPSRSPVVATPPLQVSDVTIEELELWLEEHQTERERELTLPARPVFTALPQR